jgi:hypothetical protein
LDYEEDMTRYFNHGIVCYDNNWLNNISEDKPLNNSLNLCPFKSNNKDSFGGTCDDIKTTVVSRLNLILCLYTMYGNIKFHRCKFNRRLLDVVEICQLKTRTKTAVKKEMG